MQFTDNLNEADQSDGLDVPYGVAVFAGVCAGGAIVWFL
jgi:hypothetical protein